MHTRTTKIFGIGLSKTGTTSLARALEILGYRTRDYIGVTSYVAGDLASIDLQEIDENDAFTDTPIPSFYKQLDEKYPGSKFILTTRNMDDWLRSCKKQFTKRMVARQNQATTRLHTDLYDCFEFDPDKYANGYARFVDSALDYFSDRREDLLVTDICGGANWEELCDFLGKPVPEAPFPVANVSAIQWMDIQRVVSIAKQAGEEINKIYTGNSRTRHSGSKQGLLQKLRYGISDIFHNAGHQDYSNPLQTATQTSSKIILDGLTKMNPSIPVITPESADIPFAERRNWSHLWLVQPLDGEDAFASHDGSFSVNIALIEGGKPVWGVVYDPLQDTAYYAKGVNGSFKIIGNNSPEKLALTDITAGQNNMIVVSGDSECLEADKEFIKTRSRNLKQVRTERIDASRMLLDGKAVIHINAGPTMEWETAAAHAILRASGKHVRVYHSGEELTYNKENLVNDSFIVE